MCGAATHDTVHDAVLGTPSLEYRYPTLRNGGFIAEEYSGYSGIQDDRGTCTGAKLSSVSQNGGKKSTSPLRPMP